MSHRIVIVGTGYVGLRLAESALEAGCEVVGTTRSEETLEALDAMGAEGLYWEVDDQDDTPIADVVDDETTIVYSIPTLFQTYEREPDEMPRHVRPVERILDVGREAGAERFVYLSSTSVYGDHEGAWVDETSELRTDAPAGKMRRDIEQRVLEVGEEGAIDTNVARLVGIYGPGRTLLDYMRSGRYKLVEGGAKPTNRVHVDDIVSALMAMIERGPSGARVYNVSDGRPKTVADVVDWLVDHADVERPDEISLEAYAEQRGPSAVARWTNTYRVSNERMCKELGVEPVYRDVFEGYRAILDL